MKLCIIQTHKNKYFKWETSSSIYIPYKCFWNSNTILMKDNALLRVVRIKGFSFETADDEGIKRREKFLGIDKPYGTLEDRRKVVLSEWSGVLPFNYYTLDKWLSSYLEKYNYTIEISFDEYKLYVLLSLSVKEHETYIKNAKIVIILQWKK